MKSLLTIAVVIAGMAFSQDAGKKTVCTKFDSCSLQGNPKVEVSVHVGSLDDDLVRAGISDDRLKTEVELLLRKFGVPVVKKKDAFKDVYLWFDVTGLEIKPGGRGTEKYFYSLVCAARQNVRLHRTPSIVIVGATTWREEGATIGYLISRESLRDAIIDQVQKKTKQFINAYLEANPR